MSSRLTTAVALGVREQARRPLVPILLVVVPLVFITRSIAMTEASPRVVGLPGGAEALSTMKDVHGAVMAAIAIAFLAGLCGVFIMNSARAADRRLVIAGFTPLQALVPRLVVLGLAAAFVVAAASLVTALSFQPRWWVPFVVGNLAVGVTYAAIGALAGALLGPLAATYALLLGPMLDLGIAQNPMFGDGTPDAWATALPGWAAGRVIADASFASDFDAWTELLIAAGWSAASVCAVAVVLHRALGRAT